MDFDLEAVTPMPDVENSKTLTKFTISPERHEAYEKLWNSLTYFGVLANTAVWLYLWSKAWIRLYTIYLKQYL